MVRPLWRLRLDLLDILGEWSAILNRTQPRDSLDARVSDLVTG